MNAYDEREEQLGEELMRYLERSILLQVIDNRWREHLSHGLPCAKASNPALGFGSDRTRSSRTKTRGHSMFEELMHSIWDEFGKLISARNRNPAGQKAPRSPPAAIQNGRARLLPAGTAEAQPSALQQVRLRGLGRCGRRRRRGGRRRRQRRHPTWSRTVVKDEPTSSAGTILLVRQREEVQEVPRGGPRSAGH